MREEYGGPRNADIVQAIAFLATAPTTRAALVTSNMKEKYQR